MKDKERDKTLESQPQLGTDSRMLGEKNDEDDVIVTTKRNKIIWTPALHNRFLEAVGHLGLDRAVPKKILEVMRVPGLTRENIASHLQKYRMFLKRVADASNDIEFSPNRSISSDGSTLGSGIPSRNASLTLSNIRSQLGPSYGGMYATNPPILDTSSFPILEASSFNSKPPSALTQSRAFSSQGNPMQVSRSFSKASPKSTLTSMQSSTYDDDKFGVWNSAGVNKGYSGTSCNVMQNFNGLNSNYVGYRIGDEYLDNNFETCPSSCGSNSYKNKGLQADPNDEEGKNTEFISTLEEGLGEDDFILDSSEINSLLDTFFPDDQPHSNHHGDYRSTSMNQPNFLESPNQLVGNGEEVPNAGCSFFKPNLIEDDAFLSKHSNDQAYRPMAEEPMACSILDNIQYPDGCFFGVYPVYDMRDDEEFLQTMLRPSSEEDMTLRGLF